MQTYTHIYTHSYKNMSICAQTCERTSTDDKSESEIYRSRKGIFYGIPTFVGYLMLKPSFLKNKSDTVSPILRKIRDSYFLHE